jgi:hypothetical protein
MSSILSRHIGAVAVRGLLQHLQEILGGVNDPQLYSKSISHPAGFVARSWQRGNLLHGYPDLQVGDE